jgi:hypothetical protein
VTGFTSVELGVVLDDLFPDMPRAGPLGRLLLVMAGPGRSEMALFCGRSLVGDTRASGEVAWKEFEFLRMPVGNECK